MKNKNILITGSSSGIGFGLAKQLCKNGAQVVGISRAASELTEQFKNYKHFQIDLADMENLHMRMQPVFEQSMRFDLVILNAGILGEIAIFPKQSIASSKEVMDINVWANKAIIDLFYEKGIAVNQWVAISSGAAKNGSAGWGSYSVSKAALNMLIQTYAIENPEAHFSALAPGLVDTQMQDYISALPNEEGFPAIERLKAAKGTADMPSVESAAGMLLNAMKKALDYDSGMFLDVRHFG
ncbi:MAG: SDR family NAD(P)-dependent oxidoreductase [Bacteroidales bacterium]|nr:SDR family NAD(P)-dependent oxidoreductase [Bacteroidales bacterium]